MTPEESDRSGSAVDGLETDTAALAASLSAADPTERQRAARDVEDLAAADPGTAVEFVDGLAPCLDDESLAVTRAAAEALVPIAEAQPGAVLDALDRLVSLVAADTADVAVAAAEALAAVAVERPDAVAPHVDQLCEALAEGEGRTVADELPDSIEHAATREAIRNTVREERERLRYVRETVANVVVAAAEADPTCLAGTVDTLGRLLDDPNPVVVGAVVDALGLLAEVDPDAATQVRDSLVTCLDHEAARVRARTVHTLGLAGDVESLPRLREAADADPDADVRALAAETVTFLAD